MNTQEQQGKWYQSRLTWVLLGLIAIGSFFLVTGHAAHVLGLLPYALFLLCPLMMLFMHGGHGEHGGHDDHSGHDGSVNQNLEQPPEGGRQ